MHHVRHELEEDGKLVQFLFRGDKVVAEKMEDNIIRLIRGYDLVASDAEAARTYYHYASNELGSITHVVDDREILNRYEYDVWGNLAVCEETVPNRFLFTGQQYDPLTQQYYLRARFYNPAITRFTQEDTYRGDGLNLYAYCRNNPVCYVDPSGHSCDKDSDGGQAQVPLLPAPPPILALPGPVADGDTKSDASGQKPSVPLLPGPEPVPRLPGPTADTPSSEHRGQGNNEGGTGTRLIPGIEGTVTGGDSTKLGKNMMESMGLPRGTSWSGYQAQHIFPAEMSEHPVLQKIGMDLDDASNGLFLRTPADDISAMSRHRGYHSTYNDFVRTQLDGMDINQSVDVLQKQVYELQQNLKKLQQSGLPLYPSQGATVDLWQHSLERIQ